ncbi:hypothetical protein BDQ17DRAFT_853650 [Cyathus striatus]|nr:hypothetical protein BDQ17DRAFT_853650 [Cyathus striatus]
MSSRAAEGIGCFIYSKSCSYYALKILCTPLPTLSYHKSGVKLLGAFDCTDRLFSSSRWTHNKVERSPLLSSGAWRGISCARCVEARLVSLKSSNLNLRFTTHKEGTRGTACCGYTASDRRVRPPRDIQSQLYLERPKPAMTYVGCRRIKSYRPCLL